MWAYLSFIIMENSCNPSYKYFTWTMLASYLACNHLFFFSMKSVLLKTKIQFYSFFFFSFILITDITLNHSAQFNNSTLQWLCLCSVAKPCQTLCDPMDCSSPGSSVHGILQARILEWVAISSSRGSSRLRDQIHISCIGRRVLYHWATWEACSPMIPFVKTQSMPTAHCLLTASRLLSRMHIYFCS